MVVYLASEAAGTNDLARHTPLFSSYCTRRCGRFQFYTPHLQICNSTFPYTMAPKKETKFKVAAAHAAPVFMNKAATIKKTVQLIEQAAAEDVKLVVFPETFIPGYPVCSPSPWDSLIIC